MVLIQLLLPLHDNARRPFSRALFDGVRQELMDRFGGVTAFLQSPAFGAWKDEGETVRDQLVLFEVMAPELNRGWWAAYRKELEARFRQDEVVIRALGAEKL